MASCALIARLRIGAFQLGRVDQRVPQLGRPVHAQADLLAHGAAHQRLQALQQVAHRHHLRRQRLVAREGEQPVHELAGAFAGAQPRLGQRHVEPALVLALLGDAVQPVLGAHGQQFQIAQDHRQQVVHVMRDAAGQLADRLQPLRLAQLLLGLALRRHVAEIHGQPAGERIGAHFEPGVQRRVEAGERRVLVRPAAASSRSRHVAVAQPGQQRPHIGAQHLLALVLQVAGGGGVGVADAPAAIEHEHAVRNGRQDQFQLGFRRASCRPAASPPPAPRRRRGRTVPAPGRPRR